jgi:hypothetical protein
MKRAFKYDFSGDTTDMENYDPDKLVLGNFMRRYTSNNPLDNYVGPLNIGLGRSEQPGFGFQFLQVETIDDTFDDIYLLQFASSSATARSIALYRFNKNIGEYAYIGRINFGLTTASQIHNFRGFHMVNEYYTNGTISASGTTITGTDTLWQASNLCVGSRIGFGSTDPKEITDWYEIDSINSDTSITLTSGDLTLNGVPYVIHDMRFVVMVNNSTTTGNSGLYVVKGVRPELFTQGGVTIPLSTTTDNIRASYRLVEASSSTIIDINGTGLDDFESWDMQKVYVIERATTTSVVIHCFNIRNSLTLTAGTDTTSLLFTTDIETTISTVSTGANVVVATTNHGPGKGVKSMYIHASDRYIQIPISDLFQDSKNYLNSFMISNPPGGRTTYTFTNFLFSDYDSYMDKFILTGGTKNYFINFNSAYDQADIFFGAADLQLDGVTADSKSVPHISLGTFVPVVKNGFLHLVRSIATTTNCQIYSLPLYAHQDYAFDTGSYIITPRFDISIATKLYDICPIFLNKVSTETYSIQTEPFRIFYRTTGIEDNSGTWTRIGDLGDLEGVNGRQIQFAFTFKILGTFCIPARINSLVLTYEDNLTNDNYYPSPVYTILQDRIFAWQQIKKWDTGRLPNLRITISDISDPTREFVVLRDDSTVGALGVWEYSSDGNNWNPWDDSINEIGTLIRYTADSLFDDIKTKVILTRQ